MKKRVGFRFQTCCLLKVKKVWKYLFSKIKRTQEVHTKKNTLKAFSYELIFVVERKKEILNALLRMLAYPKQNLTHSNISGHFLSMNNQFPAHSILVKFFHNVAKKIFFRSCI